MEGAARPGARCVVPTVEVIARLAGALGLSAGDMFAAALRDRSRHVVLIVDDDRVGALDYVCRACGDASIEWVRAISTDAAPPLDAASNAANGWTISVHRDRTAAYEPIDVARTLREELAGLRPGVTGRRLGLLFEETSSFMAALPDPQVILDFEHRWSDVVSDAANAASAHAAWNVCVYDLPKLAALDDPVAAALELFISHDTVWAAHGATTLDGRPAARRTLLKLRPAHTPATSWRGNIDDMLDAIGFVA